jgi:hypothetical protein
MLTKLVDRFETVVREDESEYDLESSSSSFSSSNCPPDREGKRIEDERIEDEDEDEKKEQRL